MVDASQSGAIIYPRKVIGLIVANDKYSQFQNFPDLTFTENEIKKIEKLFELFTDEVQVKTNPTRKELEDYFLEAYEIAGKNKQLKGVKRGCTLLFYYVGHGATKGVNTQIVLSNDQSPGDHLYPIEQNLISFTKTGNSFVLGALNCCRTQTLCPEQKEQKVFAGQLELIFAALPGQCTLANDYFGNQYAQMLTTLIEKENGVLKLPFKLLPFAHGDRHLRMMTNVHLTVQYPELLLPQPELKYVFTTTQSFSKHDELDQEHPAQFKLNWNNPLNGVGVFEDYGRLIYQFISLDGTRNQFKNSSWNDREWSDQFVPEGKQIRTIEWLTKTMDGTIQSFKWLDSDGTVLLAVGDIDNSYTRENTCIFKLTSLTLNHNQRLVGIKSHCHMGSATHSAFQWVICTEWGVYTDK